jgi:hypothetical protein
MATSHAGGAGAAGAAFTAMSAARAVEEARPATTANDNATRFMICPRYPAAACPRRDNSEFLTTHQAKNKNCSSTIFFGARAR